MVDKQYMDIPVLNMIPSKYTYRDDAVLFGAAVGGS